MALRAERVECLVGENPSAAMPAAAELAELSGLPSPRLVRAWPLGSDGLLACYGAEGDWKRSWSVVAGASGGLPKAVARALARGRAYRLAGGSELVAFAAPRDPELPPLRHLLSARLPAGLHDWVPAGATLGVRMVRYKPLRRAMLRLRVETGEERRTLYLKLLRRRDQRTSAAAYEALGGAQPGLRLAFPCARIDPLGGLLWRPAPGETVSRLGGADRSAGAAAAGEALAALHAVDAVLPRRHGRSRELTTCRRWVAAVAAAWSVEDPPLIIRLDSVLGRLAKRAAAVPEGALAPSHRDFHPDQCLVHEGRAVLIDLDTAAMAERELDAGNFLAHLRLPALQSDRRTLASAFGRRYRATGPGRLHPGRIGFYEASACLRLACVLRFRPGGDRLSHRLVAAADDLLASRDTSRRAI